MGPLEGFMKHQIVSGVALDRKCGPADPNPFGNRLDCRVHRPFPARCLMDRRRTDVSKLVNHRFGHPLDFVDDVNHFSPPSRLAPDIKGRDLILDGSFLILDGILQMIPHRRFRPVRILHNDSIQYLKMFFEGLLRPFLIHLVEKIKAHSLDVFLKSSIIFQESLVSKGLEDEGMNLVAGLKVTPWGLIFIRLGGFKPLSDCFCLGSVDISLRCDPFDDLTFQNLPDLKQLANVLK